jgi:hypothetical protein
MKFALDGRYPIETREQLVKSAEFFDKYLTRFEPNDRVKIASAIDARASELGVNIDRPWITNYSRIMRKEASLSPDFASAIQLRKEACVRHKVTIKIGDDQVSPAALLDGLKKQASILHVREVAAALEEFDKTAGISYLYDHEFLDPVMSVCGSLNNPKYDSVNVLGGISQYDLIEASRDHEKLAALKERLGASFATKFRQDPLSSTAGLDETLKSVLSEVVAG